MGLLWWWRGDLGQRLRQRPDQRRRVQVVEPVEREQRRHVREQLIADPVPDRTVGRYDAVYYVVGHTVVFPGRLCRKF